MIADAGFIGPHLRRIGLLAAIVGAHLLVILWFATRQPVVRMDAGRGGTLVLITLSSGDDTPAPRPVRIEQTPLVIRLPLPPLLPALAPLSVALPTIDMAGLGTGSAQNMGGCQLGAEALAVIRQDTSAMAELGALPAGVRSDADAVMLWNGSWSTAFAPSPPTALASTPAVPGTLRTLIERIVAAAPSQCRDASVTGPIFIPILEPTRTTMLVIGSGVWRWADLLLPPTTCSELSPDLARQCQPPERSINLTVGGKFSHP